MTDEKKYTEYVAIPAEGQRIGLMNCLRCGAVVMLSEYWDGALLHDAWHELTPVEQRRK